MLSPKEILEDISIEFANKTVTIDPHPFLDIYCASIHPCKHANIMKMFIKQNDVTNVQLYIVIFLKFLSSVVPGMQFDFTGSI
jgi:ubiquitin-like-conjugating enzyme ATG3